MLLLVMMIYIGARLDAPAWYWLFLLVEAIMVCFKINAKFDEEEKNDA